VEEEDGKEKEDGVEETGAACMKEEGVLVHDGEKDQRSGNKDDGGRLVRNWKRKRNFNQKMDIDMAVPATSWPRLS